MPLQLQNISLGFPAYPELLKQANISLGDSAIIPLFGENGSGKSVLLRTLAGLSQPLHGKILVNNINVQALNSLEKASIAAYMTATPPPINNLTVEEIVLTGRQRFIRGIKSPSSEDYQATQLAQKHIGIEGMQNKLFGELSDGTKQKVMLARCLAQDAKIILLDEPLAFLDYPTRIEFLTLLQKISKEKNKLIIYSSHDISISMEFADAILALKDQSLHLFENPEFFSKEWLFPNNRI